MATGWGYIVLKYFHFFLAFSQRTNIMADEFLVRASFPQARFSWYAFQEGLGRNRNHKSNDRSESDITVPAGRKGRERVASLKDAHESQTNESILGFYSGLGTQDSALCCASCAFLQAKF